MRWAGHHHTIVVEDDSLDLFDLYVEEFDEAGFGQSCVGTFASFGCFGGCTGSAGTFGCAS